MRRFLNAIKLSLLHGDSMAVWCVNFRREHTRASIYTLGSSHSGGNIPTLPPASHEAVESGETMATVGAREVKRCCLLQKTLHRPLRDHTIQDIGCINRPSFYSHELVGRDRLPDHQYVWSHYNVSNTIPWKHCNVWVYTVGQGIMMFGFTCTAGSAGRPYGAARSRMALPGSHI